jgi:YidC/Oxa1 family membrane protein insertase
MRQRWGWSAAIALAALPSMASAFAPSTFLTSTQLRASPRAAAARPLRLGTGATRLQAVVEGADAFTQVAATLPAMHGAALADAHNFMSSMEPMFRLADASDAHMPWMSDAMQLLADAAAAGKEAAEAAPADQPGLFGRFVDLIEACLTTIHGGLKKMGVPGAWGIAILGFTVLVKAITYPLNYKQMSSTIALQELQPKVKALQARYQNDPQKLNEMTAQLYKDEEVNPLAGCIPTLVQIPVFIGLYRSLLDLAKKDLLEESFLWIPSLQGPVGEYNLKTGLPVDASAWLFKGWVDGHPSLGWEATFAYLSLPVILVITQSLSQKVLQPPPSDDPAQQQTQQILKFLPLMIGWFSLNVPAGLGVYWVINNALTTGTQWYIRQQFKGKTAMAGAGASGATASAPVTVKKAKVEAAAPAKASGFAAAAAAAPAAAKEEAEEKSAESSEDAEDDGGNETMSKSAAKKKAKAKGKKGKK